MFQNEGGPRDSEGDFIAPDDTGGLIPELESASVAREAELGEGAGESDGESEELHAPLVQESSEPAVLNTNADLLGSDSELWDHSSAGTSSSGSGESEDVESLPEAVDRSKRQALKVRGAGTELAEQSRLEGGYLLPAAEEREEPDNKGETETKEATNDIDELPAEYRAASRRRRDGLDMTAVLSKKRQSQEECTQVPREQLKKDPASAFRLSWEEDDEFPIFLVQATLDHAQLDKAVLHYRSLPPAESRRYHCLVNLACCLVSLNQPRPARALLEQAVTLQPHRAAARMNLTYCLLRIRDRPNAVLAIDEALRHAEDLNADQHRLLLWTKKDLSKSLASKRGAPNRSGTLRGKRPDSGSASGSGRSPRRRPVAGRQMLTRMEVFQMRKELVALRSHDTEVTPPWGRRFLYSEDSEQAISSKKARWQPLNPEELEAVRKAYSDMAKARAGEAVSDVEEATLPFLLSRQALAEDKAVALLRAGELVEVPGGCQIFQQGDPACNGVTVQILMPDLGPDVIPAWVPVETLYDGQVFGDAKAMGLLDGKDAANPRPESQKETLEQDDQAAALLPDVRLKVHALASSPLFEGANINNLALLASNVEEIVLRYDDVFLEIGQALQACFLISGGYVRVSVPVIDQDACMGSLEDASRILGMGRLPGSLDGSAQSGWSETPRSRPGCGSPRKAKQDNLPSRFRLKSSGELPVFQLGDRPLLLPPTQSVSVASGTKKGSRLTPRRPGTPRRGTPWQEALRQKRMAPFIGVAPSELELCNLHVGECFGLAALYDPKGECPYPSKCEVRVQSSEARIMVLTNGSLLYLNETLARTLVDRAKQKGDPVAPALQDIKQERTHRSRWTMQKLKVLDRIVMHE
ncbi:NMA1 [Symbiodinium microadriaticum]|nr:NMA1 [Symbiodinium microadriaticum]